MLFLLFCSSVFSADATEGVPPDQGRDGVSSSSSCCGSIYERVESPRTTSLPPSDASSGDEGTPRSQLSSAASSIQTSPEQKRESVDTAAAVPPIISLDLGSVDPCSRWLPAGGFRFGPGIDRTEVLKRAARVEAAAKRADELFDLLCAKLM